MALRPADVTNFETLQRAFEDGNVALMEVQDSETGEYRACICAVEDQGEEVEFKPFAVLCWDNPYDLWTPPA